MRRGYSVPMLTLCLLLSGCGAGETMSAAEQLRQLHRDAEGCTVTAQILCDQEGLVWEGTLKCDYAARGDAVVEIIAPEILAGVKVTVGEDFAFSYEGDILNVAPRSQECISAADCLPRMMDALREGWLLEENCEKWQETECVRLSVDQSGTNGKLYTTFWLRQDDGVPLRAEIAAEEETIFTAEFTQFAFCDIIDP